MPVGAQVLVGVGTLLVLLAAAILVAVFLIVQLTRDETRLSKQAVPYSSAVDGVALAAKGAANDARGFFITGEPLYLTEFSRRVGEARRSFAAGVGAAVGERQTTPVGRARRLFERWVAVTRREVRVYRAGNRGGAVAASVGADRQLRKRYEAQLREAHAAAAAAIHASTTSYAGASKRSVTILLVCLLGALVIGSVVSAWVIRTILQPVYALLRMLGNGLA